MSDPDTARLHREIAQLTEEVHDLLARLQEAHTDADRLAVAVLVASGNMDAAEELGPHPTAAEVEEAVRRAAYRLRDYAPEPQNVVGRAVRPVRYHGPLEST